MVFFGGISMTTEGKGLNGGPGIEVAVLKPDDANFNRVHVHARTAYAPQAAWVMHLAQACAGPQPDGRLLSPEEVVTRAFAIADGVFEEFDRRGWLAAIPGLDELRNSGGPVGFLTKKAGG
jgi:hypothetical protein